MTAVVPRFPSMNANPNLIVLRVSNGRLRVTTSLSPERATIVRREVRPRAKERVQCPFVRSRGATGLKARVTTVLV